jgi:plastocyanin
MKHLRLLVILSALLLGACGGGDSSTNSGDGRTTTSASSGSSASGGDVITIKNFAFGGVDSVPAGTTVTVRNEDDTRHTFTPDKAGQFKAAELDGGTSADVVFDEPGTYEYHCSIHTTMTGTLTVEG